MRPKRRDREWRRFLVGFCSDSHSVQEDVFFFFNFFYICSLRMVVWLVSVMVVVVGGGSGRDEVVVELWRKRKQHIEQTRKDKCAQRKWHSIKRVRWTISIVISSLFFFFFSSFLVSLSSGSART